MNNKEFIEHFSTVLEMPIKDTSELVGKIVSVMSEELQKGNSVCIKDFGTFEVRKKMERVAVIPSTQQRVLVPPKLVLAFKPATILKEKLK